MEMVKTIVGGNNLIHIYLSTPLNICESRDPKGLYSLARKDKIQNFTGITLPFEIPKKPNFVINNSNKSIDLIGNELYSKIKNLITFNK